MLTPFMTLKEIRPDYSTPLSVADRGKYLNRVAWIHRGEGWALLGKEGGHNISQPVTGRLISSDYLVNSITFEGYDVIAGDEAGTPTWQGPEDLRESIVNGSRTIVLPVDPGATGVGGGGGPVDPGTTGTPDPFTPPMSLPRLAADIAGLQGNFVEILKQLTMINNQAAELDQRIAGLEASVVRLEARRYRGSLRTPFGQVPVTITVEE